MKILKTALAVTLIAGMTSAVEAKMKFDGTYQLRSKWAYEFCGTQNIKIKVKDHRFSFKDGGNYRWKGKISSTGKIRITNRPAGEPIKGSMPVPKRTGVNNATWSELFWPPCGAALMRVYKVR